MDRLGLDLNDGSSSDKQECRQGSHHQSIQRCIQSLLHACQCRDADCRLLSCNKMKHVVAHTKFCIGKTDHKCPLCKKLIALSRYHTKRCKKNKCQVPFCLEINLELRQQRLQHRLQQAQLLRRRINLMKRIQTAAVTSTPTNLTSSVGVLISSEEKQAPSSPIAALQTIVKAQEKFHFQHLVHACHCRVTNCRMPSCHKMKRVVAHTKHCRKKMHYGCRICKQLNALCSYHAKHCNERKCQVPFCLQIKHRLRRQQLQRGNMQWRINSMLRDQTATVTDTPAYQPSPSAAEQTYSEEKPAPGPTPVAMQAAPEAQEAAQCQAVICASNPSTSTMSPPNPKPPSTDIPQTIQSPQQVQPPPASQRPQPRPHKVFRAQPIMNQIQRMIPLFQQGVRRMPLHQLQIARALHMRPPFPASQVQQRWALQQLLQTLKFPSNSPQHQQEAISIVKTYPQLMAAIIKQRSQQGLQQLQQRRHQNPLLKIPSMQQQPQQQNFSLHQELLWRQRLQKQQQQYPQSSQFQQPQLQFQQQTRMPFTQDKQKTMNYFQRTITPVQQGVQRMSIHQPQVAKDIHMQPPCPAGQVQLSQALQQSLQTLKSPNNPQQQDVIGILKTSPQVIATFNKQGLHQQQQLQQQHNQNPAMQMLSMQQQPRHQPQNISPQKDMLWLQRIQQQQQQKQNSQFQQLQPPYRQQTRMPFTPDKQNLLQYPQKTMNYFQRTMSPIQQGVQRMSIHQPQAAKAIHMQPLFPAGRVQLSQAFQQSPNNPQQQQGVNNILKTQLMAAFIKQKSQQGLQQQLRH